MIKLLLDKRRRENWYPKTGLKTKKKFRKAQQGRGKKERDVVTTPHTNKVIHTNFPPKATQLTKSTHTSFLFSPYFISSTSLTEDKCNISLKSEGRQKDHLHTKEHNCRLEWSTLDMHLNYKQERALSRFNCLTPLLAYTFNNVHLRQMLTTAYREVHKTRTKTKRTQTTHTHTHTHTQLAH